MPALPSDQFSAGGHDVQFNARKRCATATCRPLVFITILRSAFQSGIAGFA